MPGRGRHQRRRQDHGWTEPNEPIDPEGPSHRVRLLFDWHQPDRRQRLVFGHRSTRTRRSCASSAGRMRPSRARPKSMCRRRHRCHIQGPGGAAIDSHGVVWQNWRGRHEVLSFDRRKCKVTGGPTASGEQCPEGWSLYTRRARSFEGAPDQHPGADMLYLAQIDRDDALGLGEDVPLFGDINSDSFFALLPETSEKLISLRIPYPMTFRARPWPHRRSESRAGAGPGRLVKLLDLRSLAPRRRQRHQAEDREVTGTSQPARQVAARVSLEVTGREPGYRTARLSTSPCPSPHRTSRRRAHRRGEMYYTEPRSAQAPLRSPHDGALPNAGASRRCPALTPLRQSQNQDLSSPPRRARRPAP